MVLLKDEYRRMSQNESGCGLSEFFQKIVRRQTIFNGNIATKLFFLKS